MRVITEKRVRESSINFDLITNFVERESGLLPKRPKSWPFCTPLVKRGQIRINVRATGGVVRKYIGGYP